jgi:hypothetical protein
VRKPTKNNNSRKMYNMYVERVGRVSRGGGDERNSFIFDKVEAEKMYSI